MKNVSMPTSYIKSIHIHHPLQYTDVFVKRKYKLYTVSCWILIIPTYITFIRQNIGLHEVKIEFQTKLETMKNLDCQINCFDLFQTKIIEKYRSMYTFVQYNIIHFTVSGFLSKFCVVIIKITYSIS